MVQRRGSGILSKLERNVRTGFWLLGIFLLLTIADQYLPYDRIFPSYMKEHVLTPFLKIIGVIVNCIMMFTFILFFSRYHKLKIKNLAADNMKVALQKVVQLLDTFKKEFYLALIVFSFAQSVGFIMGVWEGIHAVPGNNAMNSWQITMTILVIMVVMTVLISLIFYLFHRGFNALFGKYRKQLIGTLNELDETEE